MRRLLVTLCCAFSLCSATAFALDPASSQTDGPFSFPEKITIPLRLVDKLVADEEVANGVDLMVVTPDGNRLSSLRGTLSKPLEGDVAQKVETFVTDHAPLFNIPTQRRKGSLQSVRTTHEAGAEHISFQMMIAGVPVRDSLIEIHVGKNHVIELANGSFPTIQSIRNRVSINKKQAIDAAEKAIGTRGISGIPHAELQVLPIENEGLIVFAVRLSSDNPLGDYEVLINAENGKEISRENQMVYENTPGRGAVYVSNPISCKVSEEPLPNLTAHSLKGEFADVLNEDTMVAVATDNVHLYDPGNTHFDEVNVYYNINRIHDFFKKLGCDKMDRPLKAIVHYGDKFDNAAYRPFEDVIIFGDGNQRYDYAKEECICWHEYSHAVLQQIVKLFYFSESGAMNEGQADYFACSLSNDPKYGEWTASKMGKPYERSLENNLHYPEDIKSDVHADGQIWSGALWDLRTALGADIADTLVHKSFYYLKSGSPRFMDGVNSILTADKNLYGGKHGTVISDVFNKRGINRIYWGGAFSKADIMKILMFRQMHRE